MVLQGTKHNLSKEDYEMKNKLLFSCSP